MRKIEHKVNEKTAEYARKMMEQLTERRKRQLSLLGEVHELSIQMNSINQDMETVIGMTIVHDKLPLANYRFTQDGTTLVGQVEDETKEEE